MVHTCGLFFIFKTSILFITTCDVLKFIQEEVLLLQINLNRNIGCFETYKRNEISLFL